MQTLEDLLKKAQELNEAEKYSEVIELLTDEVLETHRIADLYAKKVEAAYELKKTELCSQTIDSALTLNDANSKIILYKIKLLIDSKEYDRALEIIKKEKVASIEFIDPMLDLGRGFRFQNENRRAIEVFNYAIAINPKDVTSYFDIGMVYNNEKEFNKGVEILEKALEIESDSSLIYYGLGNLYYTAKRFEESIVNYEKAISLESDDQYSFRGLAHVYIKQNKLDEALNSISKALELGPDNKYNFFDRATIHDTKGNYKAAIQDYQKYIELNEDTSGYYASVAQSKIEELKKIIGSPITKGISELVGKIKELLLFQGDCVTHYTSLSTAKALIFDKSKFRLSEGAFLNDTSEGRELFKFLPDFDSASCSSNDTLAILLAQKPFIGSFVAKDKHDDLTLWRMYGKEDKDEAKGCAITINREDLLKKLGETVATEFKDKMSQDFDKEFCFYRVAYYTNDDLKTFLIPGVPESKDDLNKAMTKLNEITSKIKEQDFSPSDTQNIRRLLNSIAFLFKSAEYQHEYELRMVLSGVGFPKEIVKDSPKLKVYIELVPIDSLIRKITLGPKVDRAEEWGTIFHYHLEKEGYNPEIYISHLPFK